MESYIDWEIKRDEMIENEVNEIIFNKDDDGDEE